jgi:hypothetical protein
MIKQEKILTFNLLSNPSGIEEDEEEEEEEEDEDAKYQRSKAIVEESEARGERKNPEYLFRRLDLHTEELNLFSSDNNSMPSSCPTTG